MQQTKHWYTKIGEEYNQAMIALFDAVRLKGKWVGDKEYEAATATMKKLRKSAGQEDLNCGALCSFEAWVKEKSGWVPDPSTNFTGLVPSVLKDKLLEHNRKYAEAYQEACEEFDPSLWYSVPFTIAVAGIMD
jgi:hypothetical protein